MDKRLLLVIMDFIIKLFVIIGIPMLAKIVKKYKLEKAVKNAVWAAEQLIKAGDPFGIKRKEFVEEYVLSRYKIKQEDLDMLIESFVKELNISQNKALK